MKPIKYVILGGGPAGTAAAAEAARLGAVVTLVSSGPLGGRAGWSSLLPSKVHLTAADALLTLNGFQNLGISVESGGATPGDLVQRTAALSEAWSTVQENSLAELGVRIIHGKGRFVSRGVIAVNSAEGQEEMLEYDRALIATGSVPVFFPSLKPDGQRILAPRLIKTLKEWPESIIIVGGGVTGSEFAYLFNTMGSRVTWVTDQDEMLPQVDRDISSRLEDDFSARGIRMMKSAPVESAEAHDSGVKVTLKDGQILEGSHAFIAIGRRADLDSLGLDSVGAAYNREGVVVNEYGGTEAEGIYAAGDAAGPPYLVNRGMSQARLAVRASMGVDTPPYHHDRVIEAVYAEPQIAQVGLQEKLAAANGTEYEVMSGEFGSSLKGLITGNGSGYMKILISSGSRAILGAAAVGIGASELLAPLAVAVQAGMAIDQFADVYPAHPTMAELPFQLARDV